ncbi:glycosyltransferase family 2 protein [uncultured Cellulomonas sp.]|uniref:glycosyltransferase family 2 protein n=1 Tax=uncultured Cellulomonas sp. TaxID=189682 RepID=UPI002624002A|nr:glycosyltransferase family 2 protein [uncultured Cellulomonas sp.]
MTTPLLAAPVPDRSTRAARFTMVTVTYRSHAGAAECLDAMLDVARELADEVDWVFVDNSEDSSDARWLRGRAPGANVRVEQCPHNPGFAASSNHGAATARTGWVTFVNPDVLVDAASVRSVLEAVTRDTTGARSFAVGQETAGRRHLGIGMMWGLWFVDRAPSERSALVGPSGGFAVFDRSTFLAAGGFDESLFAWGEDVDLALRLQAKGVPCRPVATFFPHIGGHSVRDDRSLHARKVYLLARNRQQVALRHFPVGRLVRFELMVMAVTVAKSVRHLRAGSLGAALRGTAVGLAVGLRERRTGTGSGR